MKAFALWIGLLFANHIRAQESFSFIPEHPQPGDKISFQYSPPAHLKLNHSAPVAVIVKMAFKPVFVEEIPLSWQQNKWVGSVQSDTSNTLLALGFQLGDSLDNRQNNGYLIPFFKRDSLVPGAQYSMAEVYSGALKDLLNISANFKESLTNLEKEFKLYPGLKDPYGIRRVQLDYLNDKEKATPEIQNAIEAKFENGLPTEKDYSQVIELYQTLNLPQQAEFMAGLRKKNFPNSPTSPDALFKIFRAQNEVSAKDSMLQVVLKESAKSPHPEDYKGVIQNIQRNILFGYLQTKDWDHLKKYARNILDQPSKMSMLNSIAWRMQEDSTNLPLADSLSKETIDYTYQKWKAPQMAKPALLRKAEWLNQNKFTYAAYADTYAMIQYRMGRYKKGLPYAKEAALTIYESKDESYNNTYALLAEKVLSTKTLRPQLEAFVKKGGSNGTILNLLQKSYPKSLDKKQPFNSYLANLEKEYKQFVKSNLKREMLNLPSVPFQLKDTAGNTIDLTTLKGKTVILDFWATWCGPCRASFPGMEKVVQKYKSNPAVKFLFIDTWESGDDKIAKATQFIQEKKYSFQVLFDSDNQVVKNYEVNGIPTKFVVGKDGNIKFKSVGFSNEAKLITELESMIELASE